MPVDLCEQLILEIFSRLPSKSLLRFRSVSKSLCACIGSSSFIQLHSLQSPNKVMIIHQAQYKGGEECSKYMYTLHSEGQLSYIGIPPVEYPFRSSSIIVGSCNGILCVYKFRNGGIHLWNPLLKRIVTVHDHPFQRQYWVDGFGYDTIIEDYKVLRIGRQRSSVYTVKTHTWHEIASPTTPFPCWKSCQCLFNGALHWVVVHTASPVWRYYLLAFDLSSEVFSTIELPEPSWETTVVTIIKGCLAVISSKDDNCRIWVMRDYNKIASWYVAYDLNSNPFKGVNKVVQITPSDELLCISFDKEIVVYNPETHVRSTLVDFDDSLGILDMNLCVESLGLLDVGLHVIKEADYQENKRTSAVMQIKLGISGNLNKPENRTEIAVGRVDSVSVGS
ncbi:putative F-box domain, galactose oxidase/kelch, beta-propeller, F-box associated interaction [Helianthus annuus]|nr:putative F-box domain, galactose oxidase/kelch, beta-propeller, F-box associated interaction [Helianthus annuus]